MSAEALNLTLAIGCAVVGLANGFGAMWFAVKAQWLPFGLSLSSFFVLCSLVQIGVFG
jgi:hypothetical protein